MKRYTCLEKLKGILLREDDQETLEECNILIKRVIECRHLRVMRRQKAKFEALLQQKQGGCSNKGQVKSSSSHPYIHGDDTTTEDTKKWVKNLSDTPLTEEQERLLAWGPKFSIKPRQPPVREYIVAVEQACSRLSPREADEMRVEVKKALKKTQCTPRSPSNITREEYKAFKELKEDKSRIILTMNKGVALVIMDKAEYNKKAEELLNTKTYKKIPEDPTNKQKNRLVSILKNIKAEGGLNEEAYRRLYSTGAVSPKFYRLPTSQARHTYETYSIHHWYCNLQHC